MSCTGFDGAIGIGTAGADPALAASYTVLAGSRDASVTANADKADISDRSTKFKQYVSAMIDCEISLTMTSDNSAELTTLRNACLARTPVLVGIFSSDIGASAEGIAFDAYIFSNDIAQPLSDGQTVSLSFAPASGQANTPDWVTLA